MGQAMKKLEQREDLEPPASSPLWIAARILADENQPQPNRIHKSLQDYLLEIERSVLSIKPDGELRSTQVIALAIATWKRMNPNEKPYWK